MAPSISLEQLSHDLRYAARGLAKSPGFTVVAVLTLALGIGANTAIFSLVNALFLRSLPGVSDPGQLAGVYATRRDATHRDAVSSYRISYADYLDYRSRASVFSDLAAHSWGWIFLSDGEDSREIEGGAASGNFFTTLGLVPHLGRFFQPAEDEVPDAHPVAVLSHHLWRTRFSADPGVLGRVLRLNSVDCTVIGVAPPGFEGLYQGRRLDVWVPMAMSRVIDGGRRERLERGYGTLDLVGRLGPGSTLTDARAEMEVLTAQLAATYPDTHAERGVRVEPARGVHPASWDREVQLPTRLAAAVGVLLLIACANLAGLLTARNAGRRREIAVRLALGGSRGRLVRQLLTEGLLLALVGGAAGLIVAVWTRGFIESLYAYALESLDLRPDATVFAFTFAVSLVTGLLFTLLPALRATRGELVPSLKHDAATGSARSRLRSVLVTVQIALSLVLLVGAGLLLQSLGSVLAKPGFNPDNVAHFRLRPGRIGYDAERVGVYHRELIRHLESKPGVRSVVLARIAPERGWCCAVPVSLPGQEARLRVENNQITPGFLDTLGIPLIAGRDFDERDQLGSPRVAIVNETLARRLWPDRSPLGQEFQIAEDVYEVVGLTPNTHPARAGEGPFPYFYLPFWQSEMRGSRLFVKVAGDPRAALPALRRALTEVDPDVHVGQEMPLIERTRMSFESVRLIGRTLGAASLLGLFLSALGLYATLAFAVRRRTRELGVRTALGALPGDLLRLVVGEGMRLAVVGLVLGWIVAFGVTRALSAYLYGVEARDPVTFGAVALLLGCVALVASGVPAWMATRVAPATALRHE